MIDLVRSYSNFSCPFSLLHIFLVGMAMNVLLLCSFTAFHHVWNAEKDSNCTGMNHSELWFPSNYFAFQYCAKCFKRLLQSQLYLAELLYQQVFGTKKCMVRRFGLHEALWGFKWYRYIWEQQAIALRTFYLQSSEETKLEHVWFIKGHEFEIIDVRAGL